MPSGASRHGDNGPIRLVARLIRRALWILSATLFVPWIALAIDSNPGGGGPGTEGGNPNLPKTDTTFELNATSGSFRASIPIELPRYRGTAPELSLEYDSAAGSAFLGRGWRLSLESYIERISPRGGAPRYDTSDTYSLDGLELVRCNTLPSAERQRCEAVSGSTNSWAGRRQSYQRITHTGSGSTMKFVVQEPNGITKTYERVLARHSSGFETYLFGLKTIDDARGAPNRVTFVYNTDSFGDNWNEIYLDRIDYGPYRVRFIREGRADRLFGSTGGRLLEHDERLAQIIVEENASTGSYQQIRRYILGYSPSPGTTGATRGIAHLTWVQRLGTDSSPYPSRIDISWQDDTANEGSFSTKKPYVPDVGSLPILNAPNGSHWLTLDWDGDGLLDLFQFPASSNSSQSYRLLRSYVDAGTGNTQFASMPGSSGYTGLNNGTWVTGDFNADGRSDVFQGGSTPNESRIWLSQASGFSTSNTLSRTGSYPVMDEGRWQAGDFNGDGATDLFHGGNITGRADVWIANGSGGFTNSQTLAVPSSYLPDKAVTFPIDVNGDGKTDIVQIPLNLNQVVVYLASPTGSLGDPIISARPSGYNANLWMGRWSAGDFNGDGRTDLAHGANDDDLWTWFSHGDGTFTAVEENPPGTYVAFLDEGYWLSGDYDGDGKDDLIHVWEQNKFWIWYSVGNGSYERVSRVKPSIYGTYPLDSGHWHTGDFDGDGVVDIFHALSGSSETNYKVRLWTGVRHDDDHLVTSIDNTLGGLTTVTYRSLTGVPRSALPIGMVSRIVATVTRSDGRATGTQNTTTYTYGEARYASPERCFLGYATVTGVDSTDGRLTETHYQQNDSCIVQIDREYIRSSTDALLFDDDYGYAGSNLLLPYDSLLTSLVEKVDEGFASHTTTTHFGYTPYGVQDRVVEFGLSASSIIDERLTVRRFAAPAATYVVDKPYQVDVFSGTAEVPANLAASTRFFYDNKADLFAPVDVGDLTTESRWNSDTNLYDHDRSYTYDGFGNRLLTTDERGYTSSVEYEPLSLFPSVECGVYVDPANKRFCTTTSWNYGFQKIATHWDMNQETTTTTYDAFGRIDFVDAPDPSVSSGTVRTDYDYVEIGQPESQRIVVTLPDHNDGLPVITSFDGLGRMWRKERGSGRYTQLTSYVDNGDRIDRQTMWYDEPSESAQWLDYAYDAHHRSTGVVHPSFGTKGSAFSQIDYGVSNGKPYVDRYSTRYPSEPQRPPRREWSDGLGRIHQIDTTIDTVSYSTLLTHNVIGDLTSVSQYGDVYSYTVNSLGETRSATDPDLGTWSFSYFPTGHLYQRTDAKGQTTTYDFDALGRRISQADHFGAVTRWIYDGLDVSDPDLGVFPHAKSEGRLVKVTYGAGSELYDWTRTGKQSDVRRCVDGECRFFGHTYDRAGRHGTMTYPDGEVVTWTYDDQGQVSSVSGVAPNIQWNARDQITRIDFANGVFTTSAYSPERGWLNRILTTDPSGPAGVPLDIYRSDFTYFGDGLVQFSYSDTHVRHLFEASYDDLRRLKEYRELLTCPGSCPNNGNMTLTYYPNGNVKTNSRLSSLDYQYADPEHTHAVTKAGNITYAYDANGSMISAAQITPDCVDIVRLLGYDTLGRVSWAGTESMTEWFDYDATDQRIAKRTTDATTRYFGKYFESVQDDNGTLTTKFYYVDDVLLARERSGARTFYHLDYLATPLSMTDASNVEVAKYGYSAFGERLEATEPSGLDNRRSFGGHERDEEIGLLYLGARYYDPVIGRFAQADRIVPEPEDPQSWNRYSYGRNDPVNRVDPTGQSDAATFQQFQAVVRSNPVTWGTLAGSGAAGAKVIGGFLTTTSTGIFVLTAASFGGGYLIGTQLEPLATPWIQERYDEITGYGVTTSEAQASPGIVQVQAQHSEEGNGEQADQPASEKEARDMGKRIGRDIDRQAQRDFHDKKGRGEPDRTREQLRQDAEDVYIERGLPVPDWIRGG